MSENRRGDFLTHTVQRDKNVNFSLSLVAQQVRPYMQVSTTQCNTVRIGCEQNDMWYQNCFWL